MSAGEGHFRGAPRSRAECRVEVRRLAQECGAPFVTYTSDIGLGGVCLSHCAALAPGERVEVVLSTPSRWEPVVLTAEVAWHKPSDGGDETGLRFVDASSEASAALADLVSALDFEG